MVEPPSPILSVVRGLAGSPKKSLPPSKITPEGETQLECQNLEVRVEPTSPLTGLVSTYLCFKSVVVVRQVPLVRVRQDVLVREE